ncbi:hypothetical protein Lal_00028965 [Lupinus albus]|nr:hypothetical protein Lal_00028965 [Lupinus albus]
MKIWGNSVQLSLLMEAPSGSLNVGALSTPFLEYSLHLLAAAAALFALSFTSSSANLFSFLRLRTIIRSKFKIQNGTHRIDFIDEGAEIRGYWIIATQVRVA